MLDPICPAWVCLDEWTHRRAVELMGGSWARNLFIGGAHFDSRDAQTIGFGMNLRNRTPEQCAAKIAAQAPLSMLHSKLILNKETEQIAEAPVRQDNRSQRINALFFQA